MNNYKLGKGGMKFWRIQWVDDGLDGVQNEWAATAQDRDTIDEDVSIDGYQTTITEFDVEVANAEQLIKLLADLEIQS